jgi:hypothetical protein
LSSNKNISPETSQSGNFYNTLYTPLSLKSRFFEVALSEVWFSPKDHIFGYETNDNFIQITSGPAVIKSFFLSEPDEPTIEDLVTQFNVQLSQEGVTGIIISTSANVIYVNTGKFEIKISDRFAKLLGSKSNILQGSSIVLDSVDLQFGNSLYLIHCDIVSPQLFANQYRQLIKIFPQNHNAKQLQNPLFQTKQYISLTQSKIDRIRVWITNESGQPVVFRKPDGFTCLLHIRLKVV